MQSMPSKNRSMMLGVAALALLVMLGVWAMRGRGGEEPQVADNESPSVVVGADTDDPLDEAAPVSSETSTDPVDADTAEEETPMVTPVAAEVPENHTVQANETLSSISRKYYGTHLYAGDIEALNPQLENPDQLMVGEVLKLPHPDALPTLAR